MFSIRTRSHSLKEEETSHLICNLIIANFHVCTFSRLGNDRSNLQCSSSHVRTRTEAHPVRGITRVQQVGHVPWGQKLTGAQFY